MESVVLSGTGYFVPPDSISTEELVNTFNQYIKQQIQPTLPFDKVSNTHIKSSETDFIIQASGIRHRRVIDKKSILDPNIMRPIISERHHTEWSIQCEMGFLASQDALSSAGKKIQDIDAIIVSCSNFQRPYPAISIELQSALGCKGFAYDINAACASASFGIHMAQSLILSQSANCILVVNPELYSAHMNFKDRKSHFIFGDGASAAVVERESMMQSKHPYRILSSKLQTQYSNNLRNNFGFLNRCEKTNLHASDKLFHQDGKKVREEIVPLASQHILDHLSENKASPLNLKRVWLHQSNINMNHSIAKNVLGRDPDKSELPMILEQYGNTGASGVMIAFNQHHKDLNLGDLGVLCSFGAGYTVGSILLEKLS